MLKIPLSSHLRYSIKTSLLLAIMHIAEKEGMVDEFLLAFANDPQSVDVKIKEFVRGVLNSQEDAELADKIRQLPETLGPPESYNPATENTAHYDESKDPELLSVNGQDFGYSPGTSNRGM